MQKLISIPVLILAGLLLVVACRTGLPADNMARAVFAVH
jgi:hypothetical protein